MATYLKSIIQRNASGKIIEAKYKFIHFEEGELDNHKVWNCINNSKGTLLGYLFHGPWNGYVWTQAEANVIFSRSCLLDIADFISQLEK